jgi:hypothetical protein
MMRIPGLAASLLLLAANVGAQERFQPVAKDAISVSY